MLFDLSTIEYDRKSFHNMNECLLTEIREDKWQIIFIMERRFAHYSITESNYVIFITILFEYL